MRFVPKRWWFSLCQKKLLVECCTRYTNSIHFIPTAVLFDDKIHTTKYPQITAPLDFGVTTLVSIVLRDEGGYHTTTKPRTAQTCYEKKWRRYILAGTGTSHITFLLVAPSKKIRNVFTGKRIRLAAKNLCQQAIECFLPSNSVVGAS